MKKVFSILLASLFTIGLCSCHTTKKLKDIVIEDSFDETKEYDISFWNKDTNVQKEIIETAISKFEALYPNIHVTLKEYSDYQNIYSDVISKGAPDVCVCYPDHVATYIERENFVVPLDELMSQSNYGLGGKELKFQSIKKDEIVAKYLEEGKINSTTYTLPFMRSTEATYINKSYVEKLGYSIPDVVTWDWIWEVSRKAMEVNSSSNEIKGLIPFMYKSSDNMFITLCKEKGIEYTEATGEIKMFNEDVVDLLMDLRNKMKTEGLWSPFEFETYPGNIFNKGKMVFFVDSTAGATWVGPNAPNVDIAQSELASEFEVVVRCVPQEKETDNIMISQGPSLCLFNSGDSDKNTAAWIFMQYLLSDETQMAYAKTEGYCPVSERVIQSEEFQSYLNDATAYSKDSEEYTNSYYVKRLATKLVISHRDDTFVTPVFNGSADVRNAAKDLISQIYLADYNSKPRIRKKLFEYVKEKNNLYNIQVKEIIAEDPSIDSQKEPSNLKKDYTIKTESWILLATLAACWVVFAGIGIVHLVKKRRNM